MFSLHVDKIINLSGDTKLWPNKMKEEKGFIVDGKQSNLRYKIDFLFTMFIDFVFYNDLNFKSWQT